MFFRSSVYGSKCRSKDYLCGQYYHALCRGQYHYNALVEREYEICSLVLGDIKLPSHIHCRSTILSSSSKRSYTVQYSEKENGVRTTRSFDRAV